MSCAVHILMLAKRLIPNIKTRVFLLYFYISISGQTGCSVNGTMHRLLFTNSRAALSVHGPERKCGSQCCLVVFFVSPQCCVSSVSLGRIVSILSLETGCMPAAGLGLHRGKVPVGWRCVFSRAQSQISQRNFDLLHLCVCVCASTV